MVKNYISTGILLIGLLFSFNNSYSQLVEFTGNREDFDESQKITGDANVDYYVSFDETTLYFGAFRTSGEFAENDQFTIYLDTDPEPTLNSDNDELYRGTTTGVLRNSITPILPFNADHTFAVSRTTGSANHYRHVNSWILQGSGTIADQFNDQHALEIAIPITGFGDPTPKGVYFSMFMSFNGGFFGISDTNYPIKLVEGTSQLTGYFGGIGLTAEISNPTAYRNTPIMHTTTYPKPGEKYANIEIGKFRTVEGEIELVAGGTANFIPGSALTIFGNFINNGVVTLNSNSDSYSSLIPNSVSGNGIIKYNRHVNATVADGGRNDLISAPLTGQTFGDFVSSNPNILTNPSASNKIGFAPFKKDIGKFQNYDINTTDVDIVLKPGIGYRSASAVVQPSTTGGPLTFTGEVNTGTINIPIERTTNTSGIWNLIGNPYPSYVNMGDLIKNNSEKFDIDYAGIYAYAGGDASGPLYVVYSPLSASSMAPGQGFFVSSKSATDIFTFDHSLRMADDNNDFIQNRAAAPSENVSLRLKVSNNLSFFHTDIFFHAIGTLDHDHLYDVGMIENPSFSIFSKLVVDADNRNIPLAIQTLPYSILDTEVSVPIGIKALQGEQLTISIIDTPTPRPLPENVEVYFEDIEAQTSKLLSTSTLDHNHHYIFTPSTNLTGEKGQFFLRFTNKSLSISNPDFDALDVYSPLNTGSLIVRGTVNEVTSLEVFDLNGRLLQSFSVQPNQAINRFEVSNLATGIYIVKLNNKTQSKIKKIQLNNKL